MSTETAARSDLPEPTPPSSVPARGPGRVAGPKIVVLPADLTLCQAREVRDLLLTAIAEHPHVQLDASAVTDVDAAGLQLVFATHRSLAARGGSLSFATGRRSPVLDQVARGAGLTASPAALWKDAAGA